VSLLKETRRQLFVCFISVSSPVSRGRLAHINTHRETQTNTRVPDSGSALGLTRVSTGPYGARGLLHSVDSKELKRDQRVIQRRRSPGGKLD
jgi:hypothetical protein